MSIGPINGLSSSYLQSILGTALQGAGSSANTLDSTLSGIDLASVSQQPDNTRLSPFAQMLSTLQQLQQSDPTKYAQVTQQIATNLQAAAQTAQSQGNTTAANTLTQLANDFTNASKTGQLPSIQDLAQAVGGHRHHHHHAKPAAASSDSNSSSDGSSNSSASQALSQLFSGMQTGTTGNNSLDPMSIILNTLSDAGLSTSNG